MFSIELFAGAGGLGIGVSRAGFKPVLVVERDRWCCDTLRENRTIDASPINGWPRPLETDVRLVDYTPHEGKVHIVSGGPPCQPFSLGGRHKASDDHRDMWSEAVRAIRETRPPAFIFENVKGLARQSFSDYLGYILLQLQYPSLKKCRSHTWADHLARLQTHHTGRGEIEYRVVHKLLNAADYGVPQRRERVVFVGFRSDIEAKWTFPAETHSLDALLFGQFRTGEYWDRHNVAAKHRCFTERLSNRARRIIDRPSRQPWRTVRDALVGLTDPECDPINSQSFHNHRYQPGARSYLGHTGSPLDEPAKTLKAGVHGVPGGENMLRLASGHTRYFTVRESARLQSFPDNYVLHGVWSEAMRQIGNAVPVTMAEVIAKSVRQHLHAHIDR
ncbi:MAG: DNA cytosine methyltransferase [Beijerinckiaceae bacterium]